MMQTGFLHNAKGGLPAQAPDAQTPVGGIELPHHDFSFELNIFRIGNETACAGCSHAIL
jgi:hypothetical protein